MALNDYIGLIKPAVGHAAMRDEVTTSNVATGATMTLHTADEVPAWTVSAGRLVMPFAAVSAPQAVLVLRMQIVTEANGSFPTYASWGQAAEDASADLRLIKFGSFGTIGAQFRQSGDGVSASIDTAGYRTIVVRLNSGSLALWRQMSSRVGNSPNATTTTGNYTTSSLNRLRLECDTSGAVLRVQRAVLYAGTKTDAELTSLADATTAAAFDALIGLAGGAAPTFGTQPTNQTVAAGQPAVFSYTTSNATSVQAERSTNNGASWNPVAGASLTSYTTPATTVSGGAANNGDRYRFVASGSTAPAATSAAVTLTVGPGPQPGAYAASVGPIGTAGIPSAAGVTVHWTILRGSPGALTSPEQGTSMTGAGGRFSVSSSTAGAALVMCSTKAPAESNTNKPVFGQFVTLA